MLPQVQFASIILVGGLALAALLGVTLTADQEDALFVSLPADVQPELVELRPMLRGDFYRHGGPPEEHARRGRTWRVPLSNREGLRATSLRAIVYSPGCSFGKIALDTIPTGAVRESFECQPLASIPLRGRIVGYEAPQEVEVRVYYGALWQMDGPDGPVPQYLVATATPDAFGAFQVEVPDFANDSVASKTPDSGVWQFSAYVGGNLLRLDEGPQRPGPPIQSAYPAEIVLAVRR